jgi:hypothetical protein
VAEIHANNMKGTTLISLSMPTALSSLSNRDVVPVLGIFHGSHAVSMGTVQALFGNIRGLTTTWGELLFGPGEASNHFMLILPSLIFLMEVHLKESTHPYRIALITWVSAILGSQLHARKRN